jgi:anthranilate phosphoribosyltransferase
MYLLPYLSRVVDRQDLAPEDAEAAMQIILTGAATNAQIAAFLTALKMKGETSGELVGFARAMRRMAAPVRHELDGKTLLDTCGTGGDGCDTFNISTIAAFVVAGAGVHVAKHGNRSISSKCGSADLLEAWGVDITIPTDISAAAIREVGIGFLFAPAVHTAMKHAQPVRTELKMRTVFNLLGPLTNPSGANAQLAGAPSEKAAELIAAALATLGLEKGFVVHGHDGLDEITTTGPTTAWVIGSGKAEKRTLDPADFALPTARPEDLRGGDKQQNVEIANAVLNGARGPQRDIVLANAAAALVAAGQTETLLEGVAQAVLSIDTGAARDKVAELARFTARSA